MFNLQYTGMNKAIEDLLKKGLRTSQLLLLVPTNFISDKMVVNYKASKGDSESVQRSTEDILSERLETDYGLILIRRTCLVDKVIIMVRSTEVEISSEGKLKYKL